MIFPRPSMKKCVETLIAFGNDRPHLKLNLDVIADHQGFDRFEFRQEWERQITPISRRPQNAFETPEGK